MSAAPDQLGRMLTLLPWLRARGPVEVSEVAQHFNISEKQLLQELATLTYVGPGQAGGELVDISYSEGTIAVHDTQGLEFPLRFTTAEAASLITGLTLLSELPGSREDIASATSALAKLEEAAGEALAAAESVVIDLPHADAAVEAAISTAVTEHRRVQLSYVGAARADLTERLVDPMRLTVVNGHSYLEGWCHQAEGVRIFRLDRIVSATVTNEAAEVPEGARLRDPDDAMIPTGTDVRIHVQPAAEWVVELPSCLSHTRLPDDTIDAVLRVADAEWLIRLMLSLGDDACLVDADEWSQAVTERAREALTLYAE